MTTACKRCGLPIEWGFDERTQKWVPLEPEESHGDMQRTFVDENGVLRADHRDRHGNGSVMVTRLDRKVPAAMAKNHPDEIASSTRRRRRRA